MRGAARAHKGAWLGALISFLSASHSSHTASTRAERKLRFLIFYINTPLSAPSATAADRALESALIAPDNALEFHPVSKHFSRSAALGLVSLHSDSDEPIKKGGRRLKSLRRRQAVYNSYLPSDNSTAPGIALGTEGTPR